MKQFLRHIIGFICITFISYIIAICFLGEVFPEYFGKSIRYRRFSVGHLYTRLQEAKKTNDVDILFLGTSHCYRGFDTRIFENAGYRSFNLGSSIQTPVQTELLLKRHLGHLNPKLIIFDVSPIAFESDGVESSVDVISNDVIDFETIKMAFEINKIKTYNTLVFGLYRQMSPFKSCTVEERRCKGRTYISGGFVESGLAYYDGKMKYPVKKYRFNPMQLETFDRILATFKQKKIPYILVQAPVTKGFYFSRTNYAAFDSIMKTKGRYYNFNEFLKLNDTQDFFDDNHLNQNGVEIFNDKLIEIIKKDKLFD